MSKAHPHGTRFAVRQASERDLTVLPRLSPEIDDSSYFVEPSSLSPEIALFTSPPSRSTIVMNEFMSFKGTESSIEILPKQKGKSDKLKSKITPPTSTYSSVPFSSRATGAQSLSKKNTPISVSKISTMTGSSSIKNNPVIQALSTTDAVGLKNMLNVSTKTSTISLNNVVLDCQTKLKAKDKLIKDLKKKLEARDKTIANLHESSMNDVLFKSNESFYDFVEQVTGKIEADILRIQGIRNARCLIRSTNLLDILKIDCDEVNVLKPYACFECKNGDFIIKQGIQLNFDNLFDALKDKHERYKKKNQQQRQHESLTSSTPSTSISNNDSSAIENFTVGLTTSNPSNMYPLTTITSTAALKYKTNHDHAIFINDLIEKFSRETFISIVLKENVHYDLMIMEDGPVFKATIKCQCGSKMILPIRHDTSTFVLSNFYSHLTTSNCPMVNRIFKEQEKTTTKQVAAVPSPISVPNSPILDLNDNNSSSGTQPKRKHLYDISCTTRLSPNKKKKRR